MSTTFAEFTHAVIPVILSMMQQFKAIDNYPFDEAERTKNLNVLLNHRITESCG